MSAAYLLLITTSWRYLGLQRPCDHIMGPKNHLIHTAQAFHSTNLMLTVIYFGNKFPTMVIMYKYERTRKNRAPSCLFEATWTLNPDFAKKWRHIRRVF